MKFNSDLLLFIAFVLTLSCADSSKNSKHPPHPLNKFEIEVSFSTNVNDDFRILLNDIKQSNSQKTNIHISKNVFDKSKPQTIIFNSTNDYFPNEILIDFGGKNKKKVVIDHIKIQNSQFQLNITRDKIDHFFYTNQYLLFDKDSLHYEVRETGKNQFIILRQRIIDSLWIN